MNRLPSCLGAKAKGAAGLAANTWLELGRIPIDAPCIQPFARGSFKMAYSPRLDGAYLFAEARADTHIERTRNAGRASYPDSVYFFDAAAFKWRCPYMGFPVDKPPQLSVNADGFEASAEYSPLAIAQSGDTHDHLTIDSSNDRLVFMPCSLRYAPWQGDLKTVATFRTGVAAQLNTTNGSPWFFDPATLKFQRWKTGAPQPAKPERAGYLTYVPTRRAVFFWHYKLPGVYWYDIDKNDWTLVKPGGQAPTFGDSGHSVYDPIRNRVYLIGGTYPTAAPNGVLAAYDVPNDRWLAPTVTGAPHFRSIYPGFLNYDSANDVLIAGTVPYFPSAPVPDRQRISVFHLSDNRWETLDTLVPAPVTSDYNDTHYVILTTAFYDVRQNLHYVLVARGPSHDAYVWRYR